MQPPVLKRYSHPSVELSFDSGKGNSFSFMHAQAGTKKLKSPVYLKWLKDFGWCIHVCVFVNEHSKILKPSNRILGFSPCCILQAV